MKRIAFTDIVRYAALAAAMLISFMTQRDLALSHGVPLAVAWAVPVAIDLYMVWSVRTSRDIGLAVSVSVAANVVGVLTAGHLLSVDTWVSAGLHAVFPLTVWRMHRANEKPQVSEPASAVKPADNWPDEDLWADFKDSESDSAATPPTAADVRAAMAVLESKHGRPVTGRMLADHFQVSERTGRRYLSLTD